jgi:NAD(P)-dependent dehydrogenase (short-subunit alcohol dehydrogenase family)
MAINLRGVWSCMKFELRQMRKQGSGAIVNCSSLGGLVGAPGRGTYHAAKHGVIGLTKSAALEYASKGRVLLEPVRHARAIPKATRLRFCAAMMLSGSTGTGRSPKDGQFGSLPGDELRGARMGTIHGF